MAETQIPPLSTGQKLFLQRLLVAHILPDNSARDLYNHIRQRSNNNDDDDDDMCDSMERCIGRINRSLSLGFGLEIRTIVFEEFEKRDNDDVNDEDESERQPHLTRRTKYHAIVNKQSDDIAKRWAFPNSSSVSYGTPSAKPHLLAYFRLILEKMTQSEFSNFEEPPTHTGCRISWDTIDLINLRNDLDGDHANKISMDEAEAALMRFTDDGWFIDATNNNNNMSSSHDDDNNNSLSGRKKQQRRRRRPRLMIGPRTYMELSELMEMLLGGKDRMPQFILHAG